MNNNKNKRDRHTVKSSFVFVMFWNGIEEGGGGGGGGGDRGLQADIYLKGKKI